MRFTCRVGIALFILLAGCKSESDSTQTRWDYSDYPNPIPEIKPADGLSGVDGAPPGLVKELISPIELVDAIFWLDGGSVGVHLRDTTGTNAQFCCWKSGQILYVGALHPDESSARLPLTRQEAFMLCNSLKLAAADKELVRKRCFKNKFDESDGIAAFNSVYWFLEKLEEIEDFQLADVEKIRGIIVSESLD